MHGLGNDFVVIDALTQVHGLNPEKIAELADRQRGIGFDQLLLVESASDGVSDFFYRIYNADGSAAEQCGNGARCIAEFVARKGLSRTTQLRWQTKAQPLHTERISAGLIAVDMGEPNFAAAQIGLSKALPAFVYAVSMGNPHAVVPVKALAGYDVAAHAAQIVASHAFANGVNVGFVERLSADAIALRVVERGAGETLACGSGACAAAAVLIDQGLLNPRVVVALRGGNLEIEWPGRGHAMTMRGPATFVFDAEIDI